MAFASESDASSLSGSHQSPHTDTKESYRRLWLYSVLSTVVVSVVPLVIMTFINYHQYQRSLNDQMIYSITRLASNARRSLEEFLHKRQAALAFIIRDNTYQGLCDPPRLERVFQNMKDAFGGFVDLGVIDSGGNQRSYVGPYELMGKNYAEQEWYQQVVVKGIHVSSVFLGHRHVPHFAIAVKNEINTGEGFYVLRATIDTEALEGHIQSIDLRPSSDVFLIDRNGILQTPSRFHGPIMEKCSITTPPASPKTEVIEIAENGDQPRLLGYAYVQDSPFILMLVKSRDDIMHGWLALRKDILWLLIGSIALILLVTLWASSYLVDHIREADLRRNRALHKIEYTNKMASIGRLAAGVAHEINNPLAIINENAGLLRDLLTMQGELPSTDRLTRILGSILKSVKRCGDITHRLLGFAKRVEPKTERLELGTLIEEVLSFQGKEAEYRSLTVRLTVAEGMPAIESDRGQLQQVFLNILSNAFAAVEDGGRIDILVKKLDEGFATVAISDNGHGISPEHLRCVFDPFFSTKGEYGTGLGLSITYGIVEKLGGRIDVTSKVGEGTTFTVHLPLTQPVIGKKHELAQSTSD